MSENKDARFHHLFKTQCLDDGAAYFGITSNDNPFYGQDGNWPYAGKGPKLLAKVAKHGSHRFKCALVYTSSNYPEVKARLDKIISEVAGHQLSLNDSQEEKNAKVAEAHTGLKQDEETKTSIAVGMLDNQNAIGHVKSDEIKSQISETKKKQKLKWIHNNKTNEELQIGVDEDLLVGFQYGRLSKKRRKAGPKKTRMNISKMSDDERVKLPEFVLNAIEKQQRKQ